MVNKLFEKMKTKQKWVICQKSEKHLKQIFICILRLSLRLDNNCNENIANRQVVHIWTHECTPKGIDFIRLSFIKINCWAVLSTLYLSFSVYGFNGISCLVNYIQRKCIINITKNYSDLGIIYMKIRGVNPNIR